MKLLRTSALEKVAIWKSLEPRSLSYCERAALPGVGVNKVMSVLADVARNGAAGLVKALNLEPVNKLAALPVCVCRR
jgi:hypothetical protein